MRLEIRRVPRFQRLVDAAMADLALRREELVVDGGADPVVTEFEAFARPAQHVAPHQHLDALRGRVLVQGARRLE
jgi:hypothetical protein